MRELLQRLARDAHAARSIEFGRDKLLAALGGDARKAAAAWRLGRAGALPLVVARGDALAFAHLSFQEHLTAEAMGVAALFRDEAMLEDPWWGDVLLTAWALADDERRRATRPSARSSRRGGSRRARRSRWRTRARDELEEGARRERRGRDRRRRRRRGGEAGAAVRARARARGGAAALARRAAAAGDVSLLRKLEPVVDLVTAVDGVARDSALHEAARRGRADAWAYLTGLEGAGDEAPQPRRSCAPWAILAAAATTPAAGRARIERLRNPPPATASSRPRATATSPRSRARPARATSSARPSWSTAASTSTPRCRAGRASRCTLRASRGARRWSRGWWSAAPTSRVGRGRGGDAAVPRRQLRPRRRRAPAARGRRRGVARGPGGTSPLWIACFGGYFEAARALVEGGADVGQVDGKGSSPPLKMACQNGHVDVARMLIEKDADVGQADKNE